MLGTLARSYVPLSVRKVARPLVHRLRRVKHRLQGSLIKRLAAALCRRALDPRVRAACAAHGCELLPASAKVAGTNHVERAVSGLVNVVPHAELHEAFSRRGFYLFKKHYYLPIPDEQDLNDRSLKDPSELVGVAMDGPAGLRFLTQVIQPHLKEFRNRFPLREASFPGEFHLLNGSFMSVDAHAYYGILRHFKPRRVVEIGSGNSTLLAAAALAENARAGQRGTLTAIEPYPSNELRKLVSPLGELIEKRLQDVELERFTSLQSGDVLFIDSTHTLKPGGDVQREYCEILPRLAPGVLVHIHDICLPKPYPPVYAGNHWYWTEQYLLQAFLAFNSRFEILWPGAYMTDKYPREVREVLPELNDMQTLYPQSDASSFWMRVKE